MRKMLMPLLVLALAAPALAGDRAPLSGCNCANECPLAKEANEHRSSGGEAILSSKLVRAEAVRVVAKNLASI